MIINTGNRTDIPAYYSQWFYNRISEKFVLSRNPYYPEQVTKYKLTPDVVDIICFCTKNPEPMLKRIDEIDIFKQFWFVTITPYDKDIEPMVPDKYEVMKSLIKLSDKVGINSVSWRYDPIFISEKYTINFHINSFEEMAKFLNGKVNQCVISFIDLYEKTRKNFKGVREVTKNEQEFLVKEFVKIGKKYNIKIFTCNENKHLEKFGVDTSGCMTQRVLEKAIGCTLDIPKSVKPAREGCNCLLSNDIGMYNTCGHACLYCYANYDMKVVHENMEKHNPKSPLLIGDLRNDDKICDAKQLSFFEGQLKLF